MGKVASGIGKVFGSLLGMETKAPEPEPPAPMPDEEQIDKAKRRRIAQERSRSGRQSTLLSGGGDRETLG